MLAPAAETMAAAFETVSFSPLAVPLVSNVTARPVHEVFEVPALLVRQVTAMVRWRESVLHMASEGVDTLIEVGAGKVLTGLARRIDRSLSASAVGTVADVDALLGRAAYRRSGHGQQGAARDVRSVGKGGAGHGRVGRHRQRHRRGPAPPGGMGGPFRPPRGRVGGAWRRSSGRAPTRFPAISPTATISSRNCPSARRRRWARPAILVHCGGITRDGLALRMKDEDWQEVLEVNLSAGFVLTRACLRGMIRQRWGRLIFITSVVGTTGNAGQANYAASKAGLAGMVKALAAEAAARGVTANCVAPGFIETAMTDALADAQKEALLGTIPAGRFGEGSDVAAACVYLASEEARYVTGQTLHVNGGMAMI